MDNQKVKNNKKLIILIIILIILVALSSLIAWNYIQSLNERNTNVNNTNNNTTEIKEEDNNKDTPENKTKKTADYNIDDLIGDNEEEISLIDSNIQELYKRINYDKSEYFKNNSIVNNSNVPYKEKIFYVTQYLTVDDYINNNDNYMIYKKVIDNYISKFWCDSSYTPTNEEIYFGNAILPTNYKEESTNDTGILKYDNNNFSITFSCCSNYSSLNNTSTLIKATKNNDYIYLYQGVIYVDTNYNDNDNINIKIYSNKEKTNLLNNINTKLVLTSQYEEINAEYYSDVGVIKYTFKKKNNDYCLESSKIIR